MFILGYYFIVQPFVDYSIFQINCISCGILYIIPFFRSTEDSNVLVVNDFQDRLQVCNRLSI